MEKYLIIEACACLIVKAALSVIVSFDITISDTLKAWKQSLLTLFPSLWVVSKIMSQYWVLQVHSNIHTNKYMYKYRIKEFIVNVHIDIFCLALKCVDFVNCQTLVMNLIGRVIKINTYYVII